MRMFFEPMKVLQECQADIIRMGVFTFMILVVVFILILVYVEYFNK